MDAHAAYALSVTRRDELTREADEFRLADAARDTPQDTPPPRPPTRAARAGRLGFAR